MLAGLDSFLCPYDIFQTAVKETSNRRPSVRREGSLEESNFSRVEGSDMEPAKTTPELPG